MRSNLRFFSFLIFTVYGLIGNSFNAFPQAASATWAGTSNLNAVTSGNVSATAATLSGASDLATSGSGLTSTGWPYFGISNSSYYQFQVSPTTGNAFTFTGINFLRSSNGNGTWEGEAYYSTDNFASRTLLGTFTPTTAEATYSKTGLSVIIPAGGTLSVRVYAAGGGFFNSKVFRVRNMAISGTACSGPSITSQPAGGSFCAGATLTLTAAASNATSYQWKKDNANISGATFPTFTKSNITAADAGTYSVVVSNSCSGVSSDNAIVTVVAAPTSVTANANVTTICAGSAVNLTASAISNVPANVTLINENFNAATNSWVKLNSSTGGTVANAAWTLRQNGYFITDASATYSNDNSQYYLSNSDQQNSATSTTLTTLTSPAFSTAGLSSGNLSFYHYFREYANSAVKVQLSSNGSNWTDVVTYASTQGTPTAFANVSLPIPTAFLNQASVYVRFRYDAKDGWFWAIDNVLVTGVQPNTAMSYAWTSTPAGFTSNLQNPTVTPTQNTIYTVTVTNLNSCSASASTAQVVVNSPSAGGTVSGSATVCATANSGTLTLGNYVGNVVRWESSTNNFGNVITIANTTATLNYTNLAVTTSFRAIVQNGNCATATSSVATVTVAAANSAGTLSGANAYCSHTNSGTLTLSGFAGTTFVWQYSYDNFATAGVPIVNNASTYNYSNLDATTYFRVMVGNGAGCPSATSNVITVSINNNSTWTGVTSSSWHEPTNWSCGEVPQSYTNVTIAPASNQPVITANAYANTLTLETGTLLSLLSNDLAVTDAINSSGNFTIANNANVIQINDVDNTGIVKVKRNSSALMRQDYTLWSSPVDGQNLLPFSEQTLTNRFYTYNSINNTYAAVSNPNTTPFAEGTGYLIRMPNNHPTTPTVWNGEFNGILHNGDVSVALNNGGEGHRFNAVGNPYPSSLDLEVFANDNEDNITGTVYFWRKTNNPISPSYCVWTPGGGFAGNGEAQVFNPNGSVRTGQGFIVEASETGNQVVFNNAQRSGENSNQFFRQQNEIERHRVWLNVTNTSGAFSQALVGYIEGSTLQNDAQIDGRFFNDGEISLYSFIGDERFAIQGRPLPFDVSDVVPMGFKATTAGSFSVTIDQKDGLFLEGQDVLLRDNLTGTVHDLNSGAYTFASEAGTFNSRFEIVYQNALGTDEPVFNANSVVVYKQQEQFVINSGSASMTSVKVYDVLGKLIKEVKVNTSEATFAVSGANQVLIFKIYLEGDREVVKKVAN